MTETVFNKIDFTVGALVDAIEMGDIGLPDIQRPFVWKNAKVRNLFDSMYRGYPVGYLLFWENGAAAGTRTIGANQKQLVPSKLIVDGQQRLTSLYAVLKGIPVIRDNYEKELIEISFNPLEERFEVADAAIRRDKAFIPNISAVWSKATDIFELPKQYLDGLSSTRTVSQDDETRIKKAISRLFSMPFFPLTALQLAPNVNEEQVSEVFVRINSEGKKLNQSDFILTLMSVFWDDGRAELERFCRDARTPSTGKASPFNHFIRPDPDQLLRVGVSVGFRRARLSNVYSILRGKDLETEQFSPERREAQFSILRQAQARVLDLQYWHDFHKALIAAGYRSERMISSQNALLFSYVLYLLGRSEYDVDDFTLRGVIAQWFFMSSLTGRYTSSPESKMEFDLARLRTIEDGKRFVAELRQVCDATLTSDFWSITLPNELATAAARSPSMFAYFAALNLLDAKALFSKHTVAELMDPAIHAERTSMERHHLFPKKHLKTLKVTDNRDINQIANFTVVEWGDNAKIADKPPSEYVPELSSRFSSQELERMHYWHALPLGWERLAYTDFLRMRRELMAKVIAEAYGRLAGVGAVPTQEVQVLKVEDLVQLGETATIEFKSTLRINLHTGQPDGRMELGVLKTIAAFINSGGGTLVIGVADDGNPVGIQADKFENEDKMTLHLVNLINDRIGPQYMMYVHPRFDHHCDVRVMVVECNKGRGAVFVKDGKEARFYTRAGTSSIELVGSQMQEFIRHRFR